MPTLARPEWKFEWIDKPEPLERLGALLQDERLISVDTETAGWETGNERLCLIQVGVPSTKQSFIIDALAFRDLTPLAPALSNKTPEVIAHNAPFEERQFGRYGIKIRGIQDTLELARELRPDLPNHTLQTCCKYVLGLHISKAEQASDWSKRPLSEEQLDYARLDAELAVHLYQALAETKQRLVIDAQQKVPELMREYFHTVRARLELTSEIATELAFLTVREELLRDTIRNKLVEGEPAYEGEFGKAKVNRVKRTEIMPELVRQEFPDIAPQVIKDYVERKHLLAVMKEYGIDEKLVEKVAQVIGYTDRLSLTLKDI